MRENKRLVWLDISASYSHSSLALPAIEVCREGDDYDWSVVRGTINSDVFSITRELYEARPELIATTLWLFNHEVVVRICERIKSLLPEVRIIMGGAEFNGNNEAFLRRHSFVDYIFRGEGEVEVNRFLRGENPQSIVGICYLNEAGEYIDRGVARVADFASIPPPEGSEFFNYSAPFVQIESSRGCFNSCAFCVSGGDKPIRNRPIEELRARIENVRSRGIRDVRILDRTFNYSPRRAQQMLSLFREFSGMNFHLEIHPALLTDELCDILSEMPHGLLHLEAGIQSLDERVIELCDRIGSAAAARRGLERLCQMSNFETHADLIAGLPHYTEAQVFSDLRELAIIGASEIQLELLKLLPGTRMRLEASTLGIKYSPTPPYEVLETPAINIIQLDRMRLLSKLMDRFYNARAWQGVTRKIICETPDFLARFLAFLTPMELLDKPIGMARCGSLLYEFCERELRGDYTDELSLAWIENGLSLRAKEAGEISKATTLPPSVVREANVHYYLWQGRTMCCVVAYDRSKEHSRPIIYRC